MYCHYRQHSLIVTTAMEGGIGTGGAAIKNGAAMRATGQDMAGTHWPICNPMATRNQFASHSPFTIRHNNRPASL